jgi:hypothetical protein
MIVRRATSKLSGVNETARQRGKRERTRQRQQALQARMDRLSERAQEERGRHGWLDATFEVVDRDGEVAGGIIAGALAYRLFIWLLPLGLSRIRVFPRPWIVASLAGVAVSVAMGAYSDAEGNAVRPMFNTAGPLLSLSAALAIYRLTGSRASNWSDRFYS